MNTLNFPDVNVWLALLWGRHVHSERAGSWFEGLTHEKSFFCRFTQIAVLRLLTTEAVMGGDVRGMREAWALWDKIIADDRIAFLPEPDGMEPGFRRFSETGRTASPKMWADAYVLTFAAAAGLKVVTFDRALRSRATHVQAL